MKYDLDMEMLLFPSIDELLEDKDFVKSLILNLLTYIGSSELREEDYEIFSFTQQLFRDATTNPEEYEYDGEDYTHAIEKLRALGSKRERILH